MSLADNKVSPIKMGGTQTVRSGAAKSWLACFFCAALLYGATANRGTQWQDSGYHILRVVTHEVVNPLGLALSHPLHHWFGRVAVGLDLVEPCFAVTLVSALFGAVAVANVFGCVFTLTGSRGAAVFGAASLAVAHTFWQMSTLAETYTLAAALLSGECWCVALYAKTRRPGYLTAAFFFNGLGIANHMLAALTTPVLIAVACLSSKCEVRSSKKWVAAGCAMWGLGALPYLILVFQEFQRSGDFLATLQSALFGNGYRADVLNLRVTVPSLAAAFVLMNFPSLLLPAALVGARSKEIPRTARRALLAGLVLHGLFVFRYSVVDQHMFFVPMYTLVTTFGGVGWWTMGEWKSTRARTTTRVLSVVFLLSTPIVYAVLPATARHFEVLRGRERHKPYRDDYQSLFTPWLVAETSADRMAREAVALAGANGLVIVEDRMAEFAVRYVARQVNAPAPRVVNLSDDATIRAAAAEQRSIVLVPMRVGVAGLTVPGCRWVPEGDLFRLTCEARNVVPG